MAGWGGFRRRHEERAPRPVWHGSCSGWGKRGEARGTGGQPSKRLWCQKSCRGEYSSRSGRFVEGAPDNDRPGTTKRVGAWSYRVCSFASVSGESGDARWRFQTFSGRSAPG